VRQQTPRPLKRIVVCELQDGNGTGLGMPKSRYPVRHWRGCQNCEIPCGIVWDFASFRVKSTKGPPPKTSMAYSMRSNSSSFPILILFSRSYAPAVDPFWERESLGMRIPLASLRTTPWYTMIWRTYHLSTLTGRDFVPSHFHPVVYTTLPVKEVCYGMGAENRVRIFNKA